MEQWMKETVEEEKNIFDHLITSGYMDKVTEAGKRITEALKNGNKVVLAGNGGSAADAQHFAGEMVGRFMMERNPLPAISLCVDPSVMTCIANDYGYEEVFARQIAGLGNSGDILIAISTSGNSENIIRAIEVAKQKSITVIGYLGKDGGKIKNMCDLSLVVPATKTPRIQEIHTFTTHILCKMIEEYIFA